ncbi:MAG: AAA family ATPase, partial [Candidatus Pacearchaeota archaeon]
MIIKKIYLKNIRSYKEAEIEFPIGSVLLSGDIGSGKTSILIAIQFALFGLQPGQKGSSIVRNGENEAEVRLYLEIDNKEVIIERKIRKSKNGSFSQDENNLYIDGKFNSYSTLEMKSKIIELLKYPKEFTKKSDILYKFAVYTPQEGMKEIIQEKPEVRLSVLRYIFGIDRYKRIKENSVILTQKIKESIKLKETQVEDLEELKKELLLIKEEKIKKAKEINNISADLARLKEKKKVLEEFIESIKKELDELKKTEILFSRKESELKGKLDLKNKVEKDISLLNNQLTEKIEFNEESLRKVESLIISHKKNLDELVEKQISITSKINSLISSKEKLIKMMEGVISLENCPTCFQVVGAEHKEKIKKKTQYEIEDINRELEQKNFEKKQIMKDIEKEKELISSYEKDKIELEKLKVKFE